MAQIPLTWIPAGGFNSTGQQVQYKPEGGVWTTFQTVAPAISSITITGLLDNTVYEFRIVNLCADGGPTPSPTVLTQIYISCPAPTFILSTNSIQYSFAHLGAQVTKYTVELLSAANVVLQTKTHLAPSGTISETFTGLSPNTNYNVRVNVFAGDTQQYSRTCASSSQTTTSPSVCAAPANVTGTIEA
jgi:hypothetical protein